MTETEPLLGALSAAIRKRREEIGMSQTELAERAGLHRTYISNIERGSQNISIESLNRIAGSMDISISELLTQAEESARSKTATINILLIEDNPADVFMFKRCLSKTNLPTSLTVVSSGLKASEILKKIVHKSDIPLPEIVFLDLNLPGKSGHELLRELKENDDLKHIPVVILTTSSNPQDIKRTYGHYANSYLAKPVDPREFEAAINNVLNYWFGTSSLPGT
ncbi:MAG: response regulator [Candidatus Obscuribacterales bacterium]|nr:response regulator [Candidatus Obscuribacterales bacterium]